MSPTTQMFCLFNTNPFLLFGNSDRLAGCEFLILFSRAARHLYLLRQYFSSVELLADEADWLMSVEDESLIPVVEHARFYQAPWGDFLSLDTPSSKVRWPCSWVLDLFTLGCRLVRATHILEVLFNWFDLNTCQIPHLWLISSHSQKIQNLQRAL